MPTSLGNPVDMSEYVDTATKRAYDAWGKSKDQYDWAKSQFAKNAGISDEVQRRALDTGAMFTDWSKKDRALYDESYVPAMREQLDYARSYTTPERMAANRAGAIAGSNITFDAAADMAKRALMGYGVDPSAGRFAGLDAGLAAKRAASAAGVGTKSDRDTEMMGQQLLANAIRTGQVLPGQAANEAGVSLAANTGAVNTGLATTASGAQTMGTPMQWANMGDDMIKEWRNALMGQTQLGMQQNRDVAEQNLAQQKLAQQSSSGIGAALGVAAPLLKGAGSMAMNYFLPGSGTIMNAATSGGGFSGTPGFGIGWGGGGGADALMGLAKKGGPVRANQRFRAGGMVRDVEDLNEDENVHRGYRPKVRDEPARQWREPVDASDWYPEWLESDTDEDRGQDQQNWVPGYAEGGKVDVPLSHHSSPRIPSKRFDPESTDYDHATLQLEDMEHDTRMGEDGVPHNPSRVPRTGMLLKGRNHPTFDLGVEEDRKLGYGLEMRDGRYYTQPFQRYADGGEVPDDEDMFVDTPPEEMAEGEMGPDNMVPPEASPSGGAETDDVHALLNEGEFVIPKDVTSWYGEKFFQNLIQKAYKEKSQAQAQGEPASPQQQEAISMSPPSFETMGA